MASGKSLQLMATAHSFQEHNIPFLIVKSKIDERDGDNTISSRALGKKECFTIDDEDNIYDIVSTYKQTFDTKFRYILVDEAQFLTEKQVEELAAISDNFNTDVICYGLKTDFKTRLFPGSKRLLEISDKIEEIESVCYCGKKTIFNARTNSKKEVITKGNQIEVGGDDKYVALCRKCYFEKIKNKYYL